MVGGILDTLSGFGPDCSGFIFLLSQADTGASTLARRCLVPIRGVDPCRLFPRLLNRDPPQRKSAVLGQEASNYSHSVALMLCDDCITLAGLKSTIEIQTSCNFYLSKRPPRRFTFTFHQWHGSPDIASNRAIKVV